MFQLNKRNKKILKLLDVDARQSNIQIAKKLGVSKNVVNYNIKKLEEDLIAGYYTVIDALKLGFFFFRVYIDFYERDINVDDEIIEYLVKLPEAGLVAQVVGDWDVIAGFYVKNVHDFNKIWYKILEKFRKHIKEFNISLVTDTIKFRRSYLWEEKKDETEFKWRIGSEKEEKIDDIDLKILKLLTNNARMPIKDIALKTKMSSMAIIYRIKQLISKGIIKGFRAKIDYSKLGYEYFRINMELDDVSITDKLIGYCQMNPHIVSYDHAISSYDFEFDMEIENFNQFLVIIDELKKMFPGAIRDYSYFKVIRHMKRFYLPPL